MMKGDVVDVIGTKLKQSSDLVISLIWIPTSSKTSSSMFILYKI